MRLLVVASTPEKLRDIRGLTMAAVRAGHSVTVFYNEDSVKLLKTPSQVETLYAEHLACRASLRDLGYEREDLIPNSRLSSLAELVELLEGSDRVVFLG
jgi:predicted peroxiredoxin